MAKSVSLLPCLRKMSERKINPPGPIWQFLIIYLAASSLKSRGSIGLHALP
jgi:hypothetical protein